MNLNKMKNDLKLFDIRVYILISFIIILLTNTYFSFEESINFGARDGSDYFLIAEEYKNIPHETLEYHKAWRFIIPLFVGFLGDTFNINTYLVFRIFTIIGCLSSIFLFYLILKKLYIDNFHIFFLTSFLIFNPYLFRYFIASPTMLNDLIFINSGLIIALSVINNKKNIFYLGLFLALISRQNSIFFLISIIITKFFFKENFFLKYRDLFFATILTIFLFFINNKFANYNTEYNDAYSLINRFNIFTFNYSLLDFVKYNMFPLLVLLPPIFYIFFEKKNFHLYKVKNEFFFVILLMSLFVTSVAYVGGPMITGKNLIRLINLAYPLIILILLMPIELKKNKYNSLKYLIYTPLFIIWSLHPTFSSIKILSFLKF